MSSQVVRVSQRRADKGVGFARRSPPVTISD
jgi:hypothetical protein